MEAMNTKCTFMRLMFDDTLECSNGPISYVTIVKLKMKGHTLGLCGNWSCAVWAWRKNWINIFSFIGPNGTDKATFLNNLKTYLPPYDRYVMVGNEIDKQEALDAGWEFVYEKDFGEGLK